MWEATQSKLAALVKDGKITQGRSDELKEQARLALTGTLKPAYDRIITWFKADMPNTAESFGVSALPNGEAFYNYRLANQTTTNLTADEIHATGLSEVARIRGEMEAIKDSVDFKGDLQAFFTFLREDDQFYFSQDDKGAQDYIDRAEMHLAEIKSQLPKFFGRLPKADLVVKRVEPFREQDGAAQHYRSGTPDGSRPGTYYAHLSDMRAMPIHSLEVIAYHEGNPGHHMQSSIAQELEGVPKFRAQGAYIPAFGEGWALYSELLAKEMGAYENPLFGLWPPDHRDVAGDPVGGRYRPSCERLDRGTGRRIFPRQFTDPRNRRAQRSAALSGNARAGDELQDWHDQDPGTACQGGEGTGRRFRHSRLSMTPCWAAVLCRSISSKKWSISGLLKRRVVEVSVLRPPSRSPAVYASSLQGSGSGAGAQCFWEEAVNGRQHI